MTTVVTGSIDASAPGAGSGHDTALAALEERNMATSHALEERIRALEAQLALLSAKLDQALERSLFV